jgi:Carboxypeptidase regulatory-like domain/TonB dependent receptor
MKRTAAPGQKFILWVLRIFFLVGFASIPAYSQNSQGTILGHVQDPSRAAVAAANITATNLNTSVTEHFTTNSAGDYLFVDLIPGTYQVKVERNGFKTEVSGNLILEVDQNLRQDFTLQVGTINETVMVVADAQMVQADNTTTGNVLDQKAIEELPSSGRDFNNLLGLVAGAGNVTGGSQLYWANHGLNNTFTEVSLNGERPESVNFMVDGVIDTDNFFATSSGIPSEFSIQEFKVQTGLYSAEYGQGAGQVNLAIKSGTNQLHGQAYDYIQNDAFNPKNPLQEYQHAYLGAPVPKVAPFKQNQFGGTLGGPLRIPGLYNGRNKTFWFFAYDGGRQHTSPTQDPIQVPTAKERSGDFSDWPWPLYDPTTTVCNPTCDATTRRAYRGNQIPSGEINPMGQKLANLYPLPNINCTMPCNNYLAQVRDTITTDNETFRVDENLGEKDRLYFTGNVRRDIQPHPRLLYYNGSKNLTRAQVFGLNWERTFNSTTINTVRIGYNHLFFATNAITAFGQNVQASLGFANAPATPALYGLPNISPGQNYPHLGNGNNGTNTKSGTYQFIENLKLIRGKHAFTFGADIRRLREFEEDNYLGTGTIGFNGQYTANCNRGASGCNVGSGSALGPGLGNSIADLLLSDPSNLSGPYPLGVDYLHTFGTNWNFFAQDDIRVTPRLTMNLGLRYELPPAFHSINGSGWGFDPANGGSLDWVSKSFVQGVYATAAAQNPPVKLNPAFLNCCITNTLVPRDKKDFAPRIGLSWRPFPTDRFVLRAGYGIFYETYMRYYDQVQNYDDNSLQTTLPASYPTGGEVGNERQSLGPRLEQLWSPPIHGLGGTVGSGVFALPSWDSIDFTGIDYILNQVNWPKNHNPYSQQWTLDTQFALTPTLLLDIGYVGSHGSRLSTYWLFNTAYLPKVPADNCNYLFDISQATGSNASCATDRNFQPIDTRVPFPGLPSMMYANANVLSSNYNSLQVQMRQRFSHGLTYHIAYTWSKSLDDFSGNNISGTGSFIQDAHNIAGDYGPSSFNQPQRLTVDGSWELPVGKNKRWSLGPANWILGGWKASGIYIITSGRTFTAYGCTVCGFDEMGVAFPSRYRPNQTGNPHSGFTQSDTEWFNPNVFSLAPQGTYGSEGKGELRGPFYEDLDLSFAKVFPITERQHIQVRFEMFNAGSTWHHGAWFPCANLPNCGSTPLGSLVPVQSPVYVSPSEWARDNLWQGHTIQLSAVYSF